jgi:glycosyltransferase involved in cell wall biosynthesis
METLVFVTQLIDPDDPVLGFVVPQIRVLTERFDVVVIANEVRRVPSDLSAEVVSLGKEHGAGQVARGARYARAVGAATRRHPAGLLAHMCPVYLTLAAPVTKIGSVPSMLWFVHPADSRLLRATERLSDAVLTATAGSYPRNGPKVHAIGHAIDTGSIVPTPIRRDPGTPLRLLALGRTSPVKGYAGLIRGVAAARHADIDVTLRIVGPSITGAERAHRAELVDLADTLAPGAITVEPGIPREQITEVFDDIHVLVNATESGSADKVVFEAMAAARPVLVASRAFDGLFDPAECALSYDPGDDGAIVERLRELAGVPEASLESIGTSLRRTVERQHSLGHWADQVARVLSEIRRKPGSTKPPEPREGPRPS